MSEYSQLQAAFLRQEHVQFLKQLSDKEFWDYAAACASANPRNQEASDAYLVCDLGSLGCMLSLADLRAVMPAPARFSLLPDTPVWMLGMVAWSGKLLAVVDLRSYLLQDIRARTLSANMLLIAQHQSLALGLLVPVIGTLAGLDTALLQPPERVQVVSKLPCAGVIRGVSVNTKDVIGLQEMEMALLLDVPAALSDIVKHVRMTASYG